MAKILDYVAQLPTRSHKVVKLWIQLTISKLAKVKDVYILFISPQPNLGASMIFGSTPFMSQYFS